MLLAYISEDACLVWAILQTIHVWYFKNIYLAIAKLAECFSAANG